MRGIVKRQVVLEPTIVIENSIFSPLTYEVTTELILSMIGLFFRSSVTECTRAAVGYGPVSLKEAYPISVSCEVVLIVAQKYPCR
jgi:hypothetical protein